MDGIWHFQKNLADTVCRLVESDPRPVAHVRPLVVEQKQQVRLESLNFIKIFIRCKRILIKSAEDVSRMKNDILFLTPKVSQMLLHKTDVSTNGVFCFFNPLKQF